MRKVRVEESEGMILCHDVTKIVPGEFKGARFARGHTIRKEDIPELLRMGKDHLYVWAPLPGELHEDEAALRLATAVAGRGLLAEGPREGKISLKAAHRGLWRVNREAVDALNNLEEVALSTIQDALPVEEGELLASTRVIPLTVQERVLERAEEICRAAGWVTELKPYLRVSAGLMTTGNEVYFGRIKDAFGPVVREKLEGYGSRVEWEECLPDDQEKIAAALKGLVMKGAGLILVTGGMSVDPDDVTPSAIRLSGAHVETYGTPVFPGAMFMLAYLGERPVLGLPGCVLHDRYTALDLVLPRLLAGEKLSRLDLRGLGVGGLCRHCPTCFFPRCGFGR